MIFPLKPPFMVGIFHGYVSHNQMVHLVSLYVIFQWKTSLPGMLQPHHSRQVAWHLGRRRRGSRGQSPASEAPEDPHHHIAVLSDISPAKNPCYIIISLRMYIYIYQIILSTYIPNEVYIYIHIYIYIYVYPARVRKHELWCLMILR